MGALPHITNAQSTATMELIFHFYKNKPYSFFKGFPVAALPVQRCLFDPGVGKILHSELQPHSRIHTWKIPQTEEPGGLQSTGLKESDTIEHRAHNPFFSTCHSLKSGDDSYREYKLTEPVPTLWNRHNRNKYEQYIRMNMDSS